MSQKSVTTTTSFIISSDESLNKSQISSNLTIEGNNNMTATEYNQANQYYTTLNPNYDQMINQQHQNQNYATSAIPLVVQNGTLNGHSDSRQQDSPDSYTNETDIYSPSHKTSSSVQSFHNNQKTKQTTSHQRLSLSSLDSSNSAVLMPVNVKAMLLHGVSDNEVLRSWLNSIKCGEYLNNFIDNGYDMPLLTRMTPQDLTAIGCRSPSLRKKLLLEIKKLNIEDNLPNSRAHSLEHWLELLKLSSYYSRLCDEGYDSIDKVCELTWEDLEDIGITKLGHQKRLLLGIERVQKFDREQEERQNEQNSIYDVNPNHRISLKPNSIDSNRLCTLNRFSTVRSGFFQTRAGANLDHRGLPIAKVTPAMNNLNKSLASLDVSNGNTTTVSATSFENGNIYGTQNGHSNNITLNSGGQNLVNNHQSIEDQDKSSDTISTMKRFPRPLPPVRTNSLKISNDPAGQFNNNSIYGNNYSVQNNGINSIVPPIGPTSFLKTPKLGTLTATTNKMLTLGGHIQTVANEPRTIRSILPVREAPLPPIPNQQQFSTMPVNTIVDNKCSMAYNSLPIGNVTQAHALVTSSMIGNQLASADEFPPPPPSQ